MDLVPQVDSIVEGIMGAVQSLAAQLEGPAPAARLDPRELERRCRDLGLAVGHELFVQLLRAYGDGRQGAATRCPCGGLRRYVGTRSRQVRDLMNRLLTLERAYYFCRTCGQGWLPLDEQLGPTGAQVTPALYEVALACRSTAPPDEAAELLSLVAGVELSAKSLERSTKAAGAAVDRALDRHAQALQADMSPETPVPAAAQRPYNLQLDGRMLRMRDGTFREVKVASLFDAHDLVEVHPERRELLRKHYEAHLGGPERLGRLAYRAARAYGVTGDGANALSQGDGAPWVWNLVQDHWPAALEVLDFYHLSEHLHACGQAVWGVGSERARQWAREVGEQTLASDATAVLHALDCLRPSGAGGQQAIAALRRYVQTHAHRMRYGALRAQGYAVASAGVESAHHGVVQRRLKRPGQRWSERGARQILAARRLWCNRHSPADVTSVANVRSLIGPAYRGRVAA
ncbi:MAG: hypothetical protein HY725_18840 [Candidatus Rokubacteria bacterium]|nr:hypothetical protein [Candidatus Rokubacteria bacterium]